MKKLNTSNAFAMLALGFTLVVVAAGCGGNENTESALTKNAALSAPSTAAKAGSADGGAGGSSPTVTASAAGSSDGGAGGSSSTVAASAAGSADGGTGKSVTVSDSELLKKVMFGDSDDLTKVQMNALTTAQWDMFVGQFSASQVASIPTKTIKDLSTTALEGLSKTGTQALTTEQLNSMSKEQLNALISSTELTADQTVTVNAILTKLG